MTIKIRNNPDGTFTVSCGSETVIVGTPAQSPTQGAGSGSGPPGLPPLSGPGGFGTAQIIDSVKPPHDARPADNVDQLMGMLRTTRMSLPHRDKDSAAPMVVHFKMQGTHTLDVGKLAEAADGGAPRLAVRIHMVRKNG